MATAVKPKQSQQNLRCHAETHQQKPKKQDQPDAAQGEHQQPREKAVRGDPNCPSVSIAECNEYAGLASTAAVSWEGEKRAAQAYSRHGPLWSRRVLHVKRELAERDLHAKRELAERDLHRV